MRIETEPHPLEDITLKAFTERDCHDSSSLGYFMAEASRSRSGIRATRAFVKQAKEVLELMEKQGKLRRDEYGWYRQTQQGKTNEVQHGGLPKNWPGIFRR